MWLSTLVVCGAISETWPLCHRCAQQTTLSTIKQYSPWQYARSHEISEFAEPKGFCFDDRLINRLPRLRIPLLLRDMFCCSARRQRVADRAVREKSHEHFATFVDATA